MVHTLNSVCQHKIGGAETRMLCTEAVVCWLWCVRVRERQLAHAAAPDAPDAPKDPGAAVSADEATVFNTWLRAGFATTGRFSQRFLGRMATAEGTHKTSRLYQSNPRKGAIVIWLNTNVAQHAAIAAINGGKNLLYGYNQSNWLKGCNNVAETHCHHGVNGINWDADGLYAEKSAGPMTCRIYYVGPKDAMNYFNLYVNDPSKWS